jgi:hypothetical protein
MTNSISLCLVVVYSVLMVSAIAIMAIPTQIESAKEEQQGLYLVDDYSQHYYDINNCSNEKGSSGGNLSECEDAEKEIQQEEEII